MSKSLIFAHFLFFDERCERFTHDHSFPLSDVSKLLRSLFKNEWCERIAFVAHQKWATMSDSLTSLRENEWSWANRSCRSPKMSEWVNHSFFWVNRLFAHFWAKNERFARKTDAIPSPDISPSTNTWFHHLPHFVTYSMLCKSGGSSCQVFLFKIFIKKTRRYWVASTIFLLRAVQVSTKIVLPHHVLVHEN